SAARPFSPGRGLRFRSRLSGADADWGPPARQRTIHYARLAAGDYRFQVRAVTPSGQASAPAGFSFTVLRPLWQEPWFVALSAALVGLAVYAAWRRRLLRLLEVDRVRSR